MCSQSCDFTVTISLMLTKNIDTVHLFVKVVFVYTNIGPLAINQKRFRFNTKVLFML
jgi:hypothetical protein